MVSKRLPVIFDTAVIEALCILGSKQEVKKTIPHYIAVGTRRKMYNLRKQMIAKGDIQKQEDLPFEVAIIWEKGQEMCDFIVRPLSAQVAEIFAAELAPILPEVERRRAEERAERPQAAASPSPSDDPEAQTRVLSNFLNGG